MNHVRFITVGFADLIANLPDPDDKPAVCTWCAEPLDVDQPLARIHNQWTFCDDACYGSWAEDSLLDSQAELALDHAETYDRD